jgi:hypothetical protein
MIDAPDPSPQPSSTSPDNVVTPSPAKSVAKVAGRIFWRGKIGPAFWTIGSVISLVVNIFLIVTLIILGRQLFALKNLVKGQLLGGLYYNFVLMDQAHIITEIEVSEMIQVDDTIPVVFDVPLSTDTTVVLTQDTPIEDATIYLNGMPVPLDLNLKEGTPLSINLDLTVPVSQTVPVVLDVPVKLVVPVDIPLAATELHHPFIGLQEVIKPYYWQLADLPNTWDGVPLCQDRFEKVCNWLFNP